MTWIDDHSPEVETEQERIEREQYEAEMDRIDLMRRINELQHELEAERGWSERFERQRDEAEKRVAELEAERKDAIIQRDDAHALVNQLERTRQIKAIANREMTNAIDKLEATSRRLSEALHDIQQLARKDAGDVGAEDWRRINWIASKALES